MNDVLQKMPKKMSGQGILYDDNEYKMFIEVEGGYLIPTGVKRISAEKFHSIQKREGGYFLPSVEKTLEDDDLADITNRLRNNESRPTILAAYGITETTFGNFLQKHFNTKSINEARFKAKTAN